MRAVSYIVLAIAILPISTWASVTVSSPSNGETVSSSVLYVATATTSTCASGVASMGVYVDNNLIYVVNGAKLNADLTLTSGKHNTVIEEWDYCGGATFTAIAITVTSQSGIFVTSPLNNSTVTSPVNYLATATSSCSKGVASMGVYVNNKLIFVQDGPQLNTQVTLNAGVQNTVVEEWDNCGGASYLPVNLAVQQIGTKLSKLQSSYGWNSWGQSPPSYVDCSPSPCNGIEFSHTLDIASPSLSGNATEFTLGGYRGTTSWGDALFSLPVIGPYSTQGIPDASHTLLPTLHNFVYDADFYVTDLPVTQVLEFDINMYLNSVGMIWGTQCNYLGDRAWDIWNNASGNWVSTGVACNPLNNSWNHVTIHAQRDSDNTLLYQSISLNGAIATLNITSQPFSVPASWYGVTVNYQMDGNSQQSPNQTYLDNFSLTYW